MLSYLNTFHPSCEEKRTKIASAQKLFIYVSFLLFILFIILSMPSHLYTFYPSRIACLPPKSFQFHLYFLCIYLFIYNSLFAFWFVYIPSIFFILEENQDCMHSAQKLFILLMHISLLFIIQFFNFICFLIFIPSIYLLIAWL